jgi:hypothetical protein
LVWNRTLGAPGPQRALGVSAAAQARSARGGAAAAAVLGRHGGGWVAMARGSVASGHSCGPKGGPGEGGVRKGRVQDRRRQRSQFPALERAGSFLRGSGVTQYLDSFPPWAREFPVERPVLHSGYLPPLGRRPEDHGVTSPFQLDVPLSLQLRDGSPEVASRNTE